MCVCIFFSFILDVKFVGSTSRGHTGFLIHLPSAVRAFIIPATRIQRFLSLVDREVELINIPATGIRTHVPTCQKVTRLPTELPGEKRKEKDKNNNKQPVMRSEDRFFDRGWVRSAMATRK